MLDEEKHIIVTKVYESQGVMKFDTDGNGAFTFDYANGIMETVVEGVKATKIIEIEGYEFIYPEGVTGLKLHMIREERIVGSFITPAGKIAPITFDLKGRAQLWGSSCSISLELYDKLKDLKRAYSEGAEIECKDESYCNDTWDVLLHPMWDMNLSYRIKGGISIESWDKHKDIIKEYLR